MSALERALRTQSRTFPEVREVSTAAIGGCAITNSWIGFADTGDA
jgi:hypothetical protein